MKTDEKRRNTKGMSNEGRKAFYYALVSKLDPAQVYEPVDLNEIVKEVVDEQGGSPVHRSQYLNNLTKIIGEDSYEMVEDENAKTRGRSKKYIFSLKKTREELYEILDTFFTPKRKALPVAKTPELPQNSEKETCSSEIPTPTKETVKSSEGKLSTGKQKRVMRVWNLLTYSIKQKTTTFTLEEIGKISNDGQKISRVTLEYWIDTVKELGANIEVIYKRSGRGLEIVLRNPSNSIIDLSEVMEKYNVKLDVTPFLGKKVSTEIKEEKKETSTLPMYSEDDFKKLGVIEKSWLWKIAGILKEYGNRPLEIQLISKKLYEEFKIELSGTQIRNLISTSNAFQKVKVGVELRVQLQSLDNDKDGDKTYQFLKNVISPKTSKSKTLARLGMTLEELQQYLPDSQVVSEITPNDNIFEVVFDTSKESTFNLALLVKGCRGTDKFFDKGIVNFAVRRFKEDRELMKRIDADFRIESL